MSAKEVHLPAGPMLQPSALAGKTILITGGGTGLGRSMAAMMARLGATVVIASRKQDVIEQAAHDLSDETGGNVHGMVCDVRHYDQVETLLGQIWEHHGGLDVLVNNAAGNFLSPTEKLSHRAFEVVVDIVLKGSINMTLACGKRWIEESRRGASVLSIVTTYAWTGSAYTVPSACGKAGVLALMQSLAVEWGKYGIRCNAIAPGPFPTEGAWSRLFPIEVIPESIQKAASPEERIPLGRVGEHDELANLASYMISDYAGYLNGACITLDGGEWLQGAGQFSWARHITPEQWSAVEQFVRRKS